MNKRLYRSKTDVKICGVCSGIANYFNVDPTLIRIAWVIAAFVFGSGVLAYFICALVIPVEPFDNNNQNFNNSGPTNFK